MVEPTTAISLAGIAIKLITSGQKAAKDPDWTTGDDLSALGTLLDAIKKMSGINKKLQDDKLDPITRLAAIHTMMITKAFNDALKEHHSLGQRKSAHKKLNKYILQQLQQHDVALSHYDTESLLDWLVQPTASKMYQTLWSICSNAEQAAFDEDMVIEITEDNQLGKGKQQFELAFYKHYAKYRKGPLNNALSNLLSFPKDHQKRLYRQLLLLNALDIPNQSIFPNGVGPALGEAYVEPYIWMSTSEHTNHHALDALTMYCSDKMPSLVTADFGFGKSLTSRMYAAKLAQEALSGDRPTDDYHIPVRIVCQHHMLSNELNFVALKRAFKSACMEQISSITKLSMDSDLLPSLSDAKYHLIIDGLDEIVVPSLTCTRFFNELYEQCSARLRITVFSRPGVIPRDVMEMSGKNKLERFQIGSFNEDQTNQWIANWNKVNREHDPINVDDFRKALDEKLQCIPIMLFMTATVWDSIQKDNDSDIPRSKLYEHFVRAMAKGKADAKTGTHKTIQDASEVLLEQIKSKLIEDDPKIEDAMLWLMGRVAWERYCLKTQRSQDLKISDVQYLINRELNIDPQHIDLVEQGVCMATQTNLANDNNHIFFQHESFAQFFIARFWVHSLKYMFKVGDRDTAYEETLKILSAASFYEGTIAQQEFLLEIGADDSSTFLENCRNFIRHQPLTAGITRCAEDKIMDVKRVVNQLVVLNADDHDNKDPIYGIVDYPTDETVLSKNSSLYTLALKNAFVQNAVLIDSTMSNVTFINSIIHEVAFEKHSFYICDFTSSHLNDVQFIDCTFTHTQFHTAFLMGCQFSGCKFVKCSFEHSLIQETFFENCTFNKTTGKQCTGENNFALDSNLPLSLHNIFRKP